MQNLILSIKRGKIAYKTLALFSVVMYLVLSTVFEESKTGLSRYASVGIMICLICCSVYVFVTRKIRIEKWMVSLFVFGIILTVSMFYSPSSSIIKSTYIYRYWTSWILLIFVSNVVQDENDIQIIIHGYILAGVFLAIYVYSFYGIRSLSSLTSRLTNEIANQNSIGIRCACSFIFSMVELGTQKNRTRLLYLVPMVITLPACLYSGSRKSVILILICVFVFILLYSEDKQTVKRLLVGAIIIGGVIYIIRNVSAFLVINNRFEQLFSMFGRGNALLDTGDMNRMTFLKKGMEAFRKSPIWGNGFVYSYALLGTYSHNNYVELLMNNGIIGFVAYYTIHSGIIISMIRIRKTSNRISAIIGVILIILLFLDVGSVNYYSRYVLVLLCVAEKLVILYRLNTNKTIIRWRPYE